MFQVGPAGRRCKEDERLINAILGIGRRGYIIDTRTQTLAQTAKVREAITFIVCIIYLKIVIQQTCLNLHLEFVCLNQFP